MIVDERVHGPVVGQTCGPEVPVAVKVPVTWPSDVCVSTIVMFDKPAAGPAPNQVPDTSTLPGVVSSGPQKLALNNSMAALNAARDAKGFIEEIMGPAGLEPATVGL